MRCPPCDSYCGHFLRSPRNHLVPRDLALLDVAYIGPGRLKKTAHVGVNKARKHPLHASEGSQDTTLHAFISRSSSCCASSCSSSSSSSSKSSSGISSSIVGTSASCSGGAGSPGCAPLLRSPRGGGATPCAARNLPPAIPASGPARAGPPCFPCWPASYPPVVRRKLSSRGDRRKSTPSPLPRPSKWCGGRRWTPTSSFGGAVEPEMALPEGIAAFAHRVTLCSTAWLARPAKRCSWPWV